MAKPARPKRQKQKKITQKQKKMRRKTRAKKKEIPRRKKKQKVALPKHKRGQYQKKEERFPIGGKGETFSLRFGEPLKLSPSLKYEPQRGSVTRIPPRAVDLRPNFGTLSRISGAPAPDHVKGVKEGDATYLNSRRYIYASFFNRVKRQVAQHWNPGGVYRRRDPYGNVYGVRGRGPTVEVTLFPNGKIDKVKVLRSSGLLFLDREAVRSFQAAQPFSNPPKALLGQDGKIRFKFSFFLQVSNRTGFRLFR